MFLLDQQEEKLENLKKEQLEEMPKQEGPQPRKEHKELLQKLSILRFELGLIIPEQIKEKRHARRIFCQQTRKRGC